MFGLDLKSGAFDDLEQSLLHPLASNVFTMAHFRGAYLVDLVEADYTSLRGCNVVVGSCQKALYADLGVFTDVACLCERGTVGHAERYCKYTSKGLGHQRLTDSRRP